MLHQKIIDRVLCASVVSLMITACSSNSPRANKDPGPTHPEVSPPSVRPGADPASGDRGPNPAPGWAAPPDESLGFASAVTLITDVTGDGRCDIAIGIPQWALDSTGRVSIRSGLDGTEVMSIEGPEGVVGFGASLMALKNIGTSAEAAGLAVGCSLGVTPGGPVFLYSMESMTLVRTISCPSGFTSFGEELFEAPDLDAKGAKDIFIRARRSCPEAYDRPVLIAYSLEDGSRIVSFEGPEADSYPAGRQAGGFASMVGDVNADGASDYAISFAYANDWSGSVSFLSGIDSAELFRISLGRDLFMVGEDVLRLEGRGEDGLRFLIGVGTPLNRNGVSRRSLRVINRGQETLLEIVGSDGWNVGESAEVVGDIDSDGFDDVVTSVSGLEWSLVAYSGKSGQVLWRVQEDTDGGSVEPYLPAGGPHCGGDLDLDGIGDVVLQLYNHGSPGEDGNGIMAFSGASGRQLFRVVHTP